MAGNEGEPPSAKHKSINVGLPIGNLDPECPTGPKGRTLVLELCLMVLRYQEKG